MANEGGGAVDQNFPRMIALSHESVNHTWNEFRREGIVVGDKEDWIMSREWFYRFRR